MRKALDLLLKVDRRIFICAYICVRRLFISTELAHTVCVLDSMEMMSVERQVVNPFFTGGEVTLQNRPETARVFTLELSVSH